uniref:Uncharacterized protein n=1 Tax=Arundo donax TaxID=35708 RepID=A0A0A9AYQ5_ARUDO
MSRLLPFGGYTKGFKGE